MIRKYIPESIKKRYRLIRAKLLSIGLTLCGTFEQPKDEVEASKDISVVVAIHDSPEVTQRCLESIAKYGANAEIILVDDGSQLQETTDLIQNYEQRNGWIVFKHSTALGHSRSCEAGSRLATRPYLCFLNSDTVVTPWSWRGAKEAFDSDPQIAVTGPTTSCASTKQTVRRAEYCRHYWTNDQICAFTERYISKQPPRSWVDLPAVDGFAFFIRRAIWEEFGGFAIEKCLKSSTEPEKKTKEAWYEPIDICIFPVFLEVGHFVQFKDCHKSKIELKQVDCREIGQASDKFPCYEGCVTIKVRANFPAILSASLNKSGGDVDIPKEINLYWEDGVNTIQGDKGEWEELKLYLEAWDVEI